MREIDKISEEALDAYKQTYSKKLAIRKALVRQNKENEDKIEELEESIASSGALKISRYFHKIKAIFSLRSFRVIRETLPDLGKNIRTLGYKGTIHRFLTKIGAIESNELEIHAHIDDEEYEKWMFLNEPSILDYQKYADKINTFQYKPKISIITPVYNVKEKWLRKAVESVQSQIYDNWELILVDDNSSAEWIKPTLEDLDQQDERIKVRYLTENLNISLATNKGLEISTGEYVSFLDNDDEITPDALYHFVRLLNKNRDLKLIYSDEDKLEKDGIRVDPDFKPDWSPYLLLNMMYTTHLSLYDANIAKEIGGYRKGYEGSQDYDFVLRFTEKIDSSQIAHIPKILYHWRKISGSTSSDYNAKAGARLAARKAVEDTVKRRGIKGEVKDGLILPAFRIKFEIHKEPLVSIIIPTFNQVNVLSNCIDSILEKTKYRNFEILIIDNGSDEQKTLNYLKNINDHDKVRVLKYNKKFNFSKINNFGVKNANGEHILFLNNDIEVINKGWLSAMLEYSQLDDVGAVGAMLLYPNDTYQHVGIATGVNDVASHSFRTFHKDDFAYKGYAHIVRNVSCVTAGCLMVKKDLYLSVGGMDPQLRVAFNDVDLCLKIDKAGYYNIYTPYARLYHYESLSRGSDIVPERIGEFKKEIKYIKKKWNRRLKNDPYYNPNLTLEKDDYSIRL